MATTVTGNLRMRFSKERPWSPNPRGASGPMHRQLPSLDTQLVKPIANSKFGAISLVSGTRASSCSTADSDDNRALQPACRGLHAFHFVLIVSLARPALLSLRPSHAFVITERR